MITQGEGELLRSLDGKAEPPMILIGGDNEFLVDRAFHAVRERLLELDPSRGLESFSETADLASVLDSFRTHSLFGGRRLLVLPEVHAFVTRKELTALFEKALSDWNSAKTDRKRGSAMAKLLHALGLAGLDLDRSDDAIGQTLGLARPDPALGEMLASARASGKKPTRGEDDAALLAEAAARGGAPGTVLLMRTGEIPKDSATVGAIERAGAVVVCDLGREQFDAALQQAIATLSADSDVRFDPAAVRELRLRLGIERTMTDKFSREVPDLRGALNEADRLATLAGGGGRITAELVREQVAEVGGGMRWELGSLFAEGKTLEAVSKLRELVAQGAREDGRSSEDVHYGRYLFAFADEIRQLLAIQAWARMRGLDPRRGMPYNRFKDTVADPLGEYLKGHGLVRQKPHPFPLHKRFESTRLHREADLLAALDRLAEIEYLRKSGGAPIDVALETLVLGSHPQR
ncbi:MAG TPA: hypothetical protein VMS56_15775 [Thermoanaerobaculia bacterium]|nr:hypothetical protein [Thermoanaerobaculia bacterium]